MMRKDDLDETVNIVKEAMLKFQINSNMGHLLYDYSRLLVETLQLWHDAEFAKQVNRKFIDLYNTQMVHLNTEGVFTELLKDYFDDVWPEFVNAFLGTDTFLFYFQVKDELGSGFSFDKGPLFDINEELIKQLSHGVVIHPHITRGISNVLNSCWIIKNKRYGNGHKNVLITKRSCLTWRKMKRILGR